jgi:N-acetylglucosaminyldiphosphoundecaprenol N-acetyl-beta-D-mannosaminyltransferase
MQAGTLADAESRFILGMRVDGTSYAAATAIITQWARQGESRYVCEAPVAMVMEAHDCTEYQSVINGADLVTPGGMPIVWMLRRLGLREQPRVYGPELTLHLCEAAAREGLSVGFYGGTEAALSQLVERLQQRYPSLSVAYSHSPPYRDPTPAEESDTVANIRQSGCQILFVGLGCPKQERWMAKHRGVLPAVMLGVGAAFDFLSGAKPQAPPWMQRLGLEWFFRLCNEPRRLWYRYVWHNPRFVILAGWQLAWTHWHDQRTESLSSREPPLFTRASCSPSPQPSLSGRGSTFWPIGTDHSALNILQRGHCFSLSPGERVGVRGNATSNSAVAAMAAPRSTQVMEATKIDFEDLEQSLGQKRLQLVLKRAFDWAAAAVSLLFLAPALLLIALLVRCSSRGPVIFSQPRAGYRDTPFLMYKFRSMRIEPDPASTTAQQSAVAHGVLLKQENDPRVTRVGRFLRSTSLDELPQLFNVLKGEMSVVGPRPLIPFMLGPYPEFRKARALVRPGITGLWQVRDRDHNTSAVPMMPHDLEYIRRLSLRLDLEIMLRTFLVLGTRKGAC